jgi:hypothetical protein
VPEFTTLTLGMVVVKIGPSKGWPYARTPIVRRALAVGGLPRLMLDSDLIRAMERFAHERGDCDAMNCWMDEGEGMSCRIR